jgi:hypothetical protein
MYVLGAFAFNDLLCKSSDKLGRETDGACGMLCKADGQLLSWFCIDCHCHLAFR